MLRWVWSVVMLTTWWALPAQAQQDFLQPEEAFQLSISKQVDGQLRLNWDISQGYYLYRQQMKVEVDPVGSALKVEWPAGTRKTDETYGESEVYHDKVTALLTAPDAQALTIGWQGCADAGLCYPPQTRHVNLADVAAAQSASPDVAAASVSRTALGTLGEDQDLAARLSRLNLGWLLLVFFGLGLLMTFTPSVLPKVPILSSLIAGSGASPQRSFMLSLSFVVPMALCLCRSRRGGGTGNHADDQALMRTHQILGPPTMLLICPDGKERRAERIIGELSADEFLARLARARERG